MSRELQNQKPLKRKRWLLYPPPIQYSCTIAHRNVLSCRGLFEQYYGLLIRKPRLVFAEPGTERQDSVSNGFKVGLSLQQRAGKGKFHQVQRAPHQRLRGDSVQCMAGSRQTMIYQG